MWLVQHFLLSWAAAKFCLGPGGLLCPCVAVKSNFRSFYYFIKLLQLKPARPASPAPAPAPAPATAMAMAIGIKKVMFWRIRRGWRVCGRATKCVNKAHLPPTWPHNETKLLKARIWLGLDRAGCSCPSQRVVSGLPDRRTGSASDQGVHRSGYGTRYSVYSIRAASDISCCHFVALLWPVSPAWRRQVPATFFSAGFCLGTFNCPDLCPCVRVRVCVGCIVSGVLHIN